jgi:2-(1,2-epoxy-1,2-dihydrophenyl)acetyl-CoA isomerase
LSQIDSQSITITRDRGVATVILDRPKVKNALTNADFARLGEVFDEIASNPEDRVMVLTGRGSAFCAGADLSGSPATAQRIQQGPIDREQWIRETTQPALSLHRLPKPTIAAVNGVAAGGGCNLALGCDIVFASESARFTEVFINRGLSLDYGGSWLLPKLIGMQRAKDIAFRGDVIDVKEAERLGLVLEVVPDEQLMSRVQEYAAMLAEKPPIALSLIKSGINKLANASFEEGLAFEAQAQSTCLGSEDFREAMLAWAQKRDGEYTGK